MIINFLLSLLLFNVGLILLTYQFANWSSESSGIFFLISGFVLCIVGYSILFASLRDVIL